MKRYGPTFLRSIKGNKIVPVTMKSSPYSSSTHGVRSQDIEFYNDKSSYEIISEVGSSSASEGIEEVFVPDGDTQMRDFKPIIYTVNDLYQCTATTLIGFEKTNTIWVPKKTLCTHFRPGSDEGEFSLHNTVISRNAADLSWLIIDFKSAVVPYNTDDGPESLTFSSADILTNSIFEVCHIPMVEIGKKSNKSGVRMQTYIKEITTLPNGKSMIKVRTL